MADTFSDAEKMTVLDILSWTLQLCLIY